MPKNTAHTDRERVAACRREFPALDALVHGKALVYLDNAATNQVSRSVIDAVQHHLCHENANTHRGIHYLSEQATLHFEEARAEVARFIKAPHAENVIFTSGTTAGLNLLALGLEARLTAADAVLTTRMEHHSNFVPWQQLCHRTGAEFRVVPLTETGELDRSAYSALLADGRVKLVALTCVSNVTGIINPVQELLAEARQAGALTVLDAAQAVRCGLIDVQQLGCDFCCFSAHKMIGPTGVGVMFGTESALQGLAVRTFGGGMVDDVQLHTTEISAAPFRFEAGTPNIVGIAGLRAALADLQGFGLSWIYNYEQQLLTYAEAQLRGIDGVTVLGRVSRRCGAISFSVNDRHPYDLASVMDKQGVAVRVGHHCAIPHLRHYGQTAVMRISPAFYTTFVEIDACLQALQQAIAFFGRWGNH